MRTSPKKVQVGDVLFEASAFHKKVVQWIVCGFYIDYKTMSAVVQVFSKYTCITERSPEVVCCWHDTAEEAQKCLEEMLYDGEDSEDSE